MRHSLLGHIPRKKSGRAANNAADRNMPISRRTVTRRSNDSELAQVSPRFKTGRAAKLPPRTLHERNSYAPTAAPTRIIIAAHRRARHYGTQGLRSWWHRFGRPAEPAQERPLELHAARQRAIDHEVGARNETGRRAGQEHHGPGHLLRPAHAPGRIQRHRLLEQFRIAVLDLFPDAAGKISVAGRQCIDADALAGKLVGQPLA